MQIKAVRRATSVEVVDFVSSLSCAPEMMEIIQEGCAVDFSTERGLKSFCYLSSKSPDRNLHILCSSCGGLTTDLRLVSYRSSSRSRGWRFTIRHYGGRRG